jgi:hypothetical protein
MSRLNEFISEDSNQFGPGTDLVIAMMGVLLVMILISGQMYSRERKQNKDARATRAEEQRGHEKLKLSYDELRRKYEELLSRQQTAAADAAGKFKLAAHYFSAGNFHARPVDRLIDPARTAETVELIARQYEGLSAEYPFIFVIGHSNQLDDLYAEEQGDAPRMRRNWVYAARRAGVVAELLQSRLPPEQRDRIVVVTTGEFDLKDPSEPNSQENALVEVIFGKEWKPPARLTP